LDAMKALAFLIIGFSFGVARAAWLGTTIGIIMAIIISAVAMVILFSVIAERS
jgi:hypothetical protein